MKNLIIVDLEATCEENNPEYNKEIIEIGAVKVSNGIIIDEFDVFVKPIGNPNLSDFCKNLTHITQEDVNNGLAPNEAIKSFYKWATNNYEDDVIYLSWGGFDKNQLLKESKNNNLGPVIEMELNNKHLNLKFVYAKVLNLKRQLGTVKALQKEGLQFDGSNHRAIDDVKNINRIYNCQKKKIDNYIFK